MADAGGTSIRPELPGDVEAVGALHAAAFGDQVVPRLVAELRRRTRPGDLVSLVAERDGHVAGHVLLTPIPLETAPGTLRDVACLSPLGVLPQDQGRGIGRALVEAALAAAERRGEPFVLLEGDPALYARFGFEPASRHGLRRPSERTPEPAFQVRVLSAGGPTPRGRVLYPPVFWELDAIGLPVEGPTWLDEIERHARTVEQALASRGTTAAALDAAVPHCPGWTVAEVLRHLGVVHRVAAAWISGGRRPLPGTIPAGPRDGDVPAWFVAGWRGLQELLDDLPADTCVAGWCPWDPTAGFWRRRQAHELAVHAFDVLAALAAERSWEVGEEVALDGIDEVLRLWLGTRLGRDVGGTGQLIRLEAGGRAWTVGLHQHLAEVHRLPASADAGVAGAPAALYRWLWGRAGQHEVTVSGDEAAVARLGEALRRATQ